MIQPFKLERFYAIHEFTAKYLLCSSDCESMTIDEVLALESGAHEKFSHLRLGYTETPGNPLLRKDISAMYSSLSPDNIVVCAGAQEPIYLFCQAILSRGDEVIIQFPCYQSIQSVPESMGCKVSNWMVEYKDEKPVFDVEKLEQLITPKTKVIFINTPHNPTGFHFTKQQQLDIARIARAHNIIIFCDEVYRDLEHSPELRLPAFADIYENAVSLGVMSKSYGLAGLRLGWIASQNRKLLESILILKEYTTICTAAPSEFLAGVALRNRGKIIRRNLEIVKINVPLLKDFFKRHQHLFSWAQPDAGPVGLARMRFNQDDLAFANNVVKKKNVLLLPGEVFDYKGCFRIGFVRKNMSDALTRFEEYLEENPIR